LTETFSAATAPPEHRYHQQAARAVLKALLPEAGIDIRGHLRSQQELLEASDYERRPKDFADLLRILDSEVRLITPTDPQGGEREDSSPATADAGQRFYQLTHDYLVPSLRSWLTRKQQETLRGRAELRFEEAAALWESRRDKSFLPSLWNWLRFGVLIPKRNWTASQRTMMQMAARRHSLRILAAVLLLGGLSWGGFQMRQRMKAESLVSNLRSAAITEVPKLIEGMSELGGRAEPLLQQALAESSEDSRERLNFSLALVDVDSGQTACLLERSLQADPTTVTVIRDRLDRHSEQIADQLWECLARSDDHSSRRFRAAQMLAGHSPQTPRDKARWHTAGEFVAEQFVGETIGNPASYTALVELFRPVRLQLAEPLGKIFRAADQPGKSGRRLAAGNILSEYLAEEADLLAGLILDSDADQYAKLFPLLSRFPTRTFELMTAAVDSAPAESADSSEKERTARRTANAAVTLLRLDRPGKVWPVFRHSSDPRARSYLIHRLEPYGVSPRLIARRLDEETDTSATRALLLALGEFSESYFPLEQRELLLPRVQSFFQSHPDAGIHSASQWILQKWKLPVPVPTPAEGSSGWTINTDGHVMVVVDASSVPAIGRKFEIATREVTVEQLRHFKPDAYSQPQVAPTDDCPANVVTWFTAIKYCQWLSEKEIPSQEWCYPPSDQLDDLTLHIADTTKTGYRLPTRAEWEFACRAGAVTSRYFGETDDLLEKYAWYQGNARRRLWPGGRLKPNDFGLFDMLGNCAEWSGDIDRPRVWLCGSATYHSPADNVRTVIPDRALPNTEFNSYGFRVVRTHPAE
jgi:hypothetical protein